MTCPCGGIVLADTDEWSVPRCFDCWYALRFVVLVLAIGGTR
jgi:hypothetical protein